MTYDHAQALPADVGRLEAPVRRTMAELLHPSEGSMVEFWCHRMSQQGKAGTGIRGWFCGGLFWSHDNADHYALGEVAHWTCLRSRLQCAARRSARSQCARPACRDRIAGRSPRR